MSNYLVQITENEDGEVDEPRWCAAGGSGDTDRTLCGETLDQASHVVFKQKITKRGGITCHMCIDFIKEIKGYKL